MGMLGAALRRGRWPLSVLALLALYALAGFQLAPWLIRRELPQLVREAVGRDAVIGEVRFNPFTLRLQAADFELRSADNSKLAGFGALVVDLDASSLWRRALVLAELRLERPYVDVVRDRAGAINLQQLVPPADPSATAPPAESALPRIVIERFRLTEGVIDVKDEVPASGFSTRVGPVDVALENISTLPDVTGRQQFAMTFESGTTLELAGDVVLEPLGASGELRLAGPALGLAHRYIRDQLRFEAPAGRVAAAMRFALRSAADAALTVELSDIDVRVKDLQLSAPQAPQFLGWSELHLAGGALRWPAREFSAAEIVLRGPVVNAVRDASGRIDLIELLAPPASAPASEAVPAEPPADAAPWKVTIGKLAIEDLRARFLDQVPAAPARFVVADLDVALRQLSLEPGARLPLEARLALEPGGVVQITGSLGLLPQPQLEAELSVSDLPLALAQSYVSDVARIAVRAGTLGIDARIAAGPGESLAFEGDVRVRDLDTYDQGKAERLLAWRELAIDDVELRLDKQDLRVARVRLERPFARVFIAADQSTNIGDVLVAAESTAPAPAAPTASPSVEAAPFRARVGRILVRRGEVDFTDLSLPLPFAARIEDMQGEFTTVDTRSRAPSRIALEGRVGEYGLSQVKGEVRVSAPTELADIGVVFRNIEMAPLSPYTVKFAGRKIDGGKINLDLRYRLDARQMRGENKIVIDELVLGDKVPHPDAVDLPLGLAVALLRDANGRIDIDMPVSGSLDDPEFGIGRVVWKAFVTLVTKVATAPFRLLGSLVGIESDDLGRIEFAPGRAELLPPEREKLVRVGEALAKRPQLAVAVPQVFDPEVDGAVLRMERAQAAIDAALAAGGAPESGRGLEKRTRRVIETLYQQQFPERDPGALEAAFTRPPPEDPAGRARLDELAYLDQMRADLAAAQPIGPAELTALGAARAAAVVEALGGAERVRAGESRQVRARDGAWIGADLDLQARGAE